MTTDRIADPLRDIIRAEVSRLSYLATWEYRVTGVNGDGTVNCVSTDASMPDLNNVPIQADAAGSTGAPSTDAACYVRFINGSPTRPVVVGNQPLVKSATIDATDTVAIGASVSNAVILAGGNAPIARLGDAVTVYFPTAPMPAVGVFASGPPGTFTGTITIVLPATGVITSGQPKVLA